jgi:ribosomal protein S18 acetylase RimI-like enzyme
MYIFSLQTKIEDVGFLAYKPNEYQPWLAIVNGEYCGYVTLNKDNAINQIWVDKGYRNRGVGEMLVKHICNVILSDNEQVRITTPTDVGKRFFKSISDNGEVFGKKLLYW